MPVAWPDIANPSGFKEKDIKPQHESTSASGYTSTRSKGTAVKVQFTMSWKAMTSADKAVFRAFYAANKGQQIIFPHPGTAKNYTVVLLGDEIEYEWVSDGEVWKTTELVLKEI